MAPRSVVTWFTFILTELILFGFLFTTTLWFILAILHWEQALVIYVTLFVLYMVAKRIRLKSDYNHAINRWTTTWVQLIEDDPTLIESMLGQYNESTEDINDFIKNEIIRLVHSQINPDHILLDHTLKRFDINNSAPQNSKG